MFSSQRKEAASSSKKIAWTPRDEDSLLDTTRQALVYNLTKVQNRVAEGLVPWFTSQMPESYFKQVAPHTQLQHLRSMSAQYDYTAGDFIKSGKGRVVFQSTTSEGNLEVRRSQRFAFGAAGRP